jgi:hypothetical protein
LRKSAGVLFSEVAFMNARALESALLTRCADVVHDVRQVARDQCEANVFRLAAMVVQSRFPRESGQLMRVSDEYFAMHPGERLAPADVLGKGWLIGLPRLRDMLSQRLLGRR